MQRRCPCTWAQIPRGPTLVSKLPCLNPGTFTGAAAQVAAGAGTVPEPVGQALRSFGGHAAAVPNRPSRLAPQQTSGPADATQVYMSPARRSPFGLNGTGCGVFAHAIWCPGDPQRSLAGTPS
jgi:hypothetical protein